MQNLSSYDKLMTLLFSSSFQVQLLSILIVLAYFIWKTARSKHHRISSYVVICSLCGAVIVSCGKILAMIARFSLNVNPLNQEKKTETQISHLLLPSPKYSPYIAHFFTILLIISIITQEFFKQHAYSRFKVSTFNPMLYAGFNVW